MKTKQNEDPGFEIIKEVPGAGGSGGGMPRMGNPFGALAGGGANLFGSNPSLASLGALLGGQGGQNSLLQKCK